MKRELELKIERLHLEPNRRILITSDLHGGLEVFKDVLNKASYTSEDYLFILGDIIEKGPNSLDTLHYVMELVKNHRTFVLMGNNDTIAFDIVNDENIDYLYYYVSNRSSIYKDMADALGIMLTSETNYYEVNKLLLENFKEELEFLLNLPHIIETDRFIFAHAGIENFDELSQNNPLKVMKTDVFMDNCQISPKLCFVGHYPTLAYAYKIADCSPKRNFQKRIISIDGGYAVKSEGQINLLAIESEQNVNIDYFYSDNLDEYMVIENQDGSNDCSLVIWNREKIEVIEEKSDSYMCLIDSKVKLEIPKEFIYKLNGIYYCCDYTNYILPLQRGDIVRLVQNYGQKCLVKKGPIIGWVETKKIKTISN